MNINDLTENNIVLDKIVANIDDFKLADQQVRQVRIIQYKQQNNLYYSLFVFDTLHYCSIIVENIFEQNELEHIALCPSNDIKIQIGDNDYDCVVIHLNKLKSLIEYYNNVIDCLNKRLYSENDQNVRKQIYADICNYENIIGEYNIKLNLLVNFFEHFNQNYILK